MTLADVRSIGTHQRGGAMAGRIDEVLAIEDSTQFAMALINHVHGGEGRRAGIACADF